MQSAGRGHVGAIVGRGDGYDTMGMGGCGRMWGWVRGVDKCGFGCGRAGVVVRLSGGGHELLGHPPP